MSIQKKLDDIKRRIGDQELQNNHFPQAKEEKEDKTFSSTYHEDIKKGREQVEKEVENFWHS